MSDDQYSLIDAISRAAEAWRDPEHGARADAVEKTLEAPNRFTEEAVTFAINQQMHQCAPDQLAAWLDGRHAARPRVVGVLNAGNIPLAGLQDFLAVVLTGHRYRGAASSKSPHLLPAFAEEVRAQASDLPVQFTEAEALFAKADAVIATGTDETRSWAAAQCEEYGISPSRRLLRGNRYGVAVLDGSESEDEREGLAEDMLLHEGAGCRNVALLWAPRDLSPDPYLEAMAQCRGVFPVHADTPGTLQMQQAFLDAVDTAHAYGEGLEFLVSKGAPEVQKPGHVRWVEYDDLSDVERWLDAHADEVQLMVTRDQVAERLATPVPRVPPGTAQRPPLDWQPDGRDTVAFLAGL